MTLHSEMLFAVSLFLTIVISNFLARVVLRRIGARAIGFERYEDGALVVTIAAVAAEAALCAWPAATVVSVAVGFAFAFYVRVVLADGT